MCGLDDESDDVLNFISELLFALLSNEALSVFLEVEFIFEVLVDPSVLFDVGFSADEADSVSLDFECGFPFEDGFPFADSSELGGLLSFVESLELELAS